MTTRTTAQKIGRYVQYQRIKMGYSLQDFAKCTDLTPSFLMRLERGEYDTVKFDVIEKLCGGLKIHLPDFLAKCELMSNMNYLPTLEFFLKEKYQFPKEAISEVTEYLLFIEQKYQKDIEKMKKLHKEYWKK